MLPRRWGCTRTQELTVDVIGVDEDAASITVTEAATGPTADRPGTDDDAATDAGANQGTRGTAGAIADRRTLRVAPAAAEMLSRVKAGDRVRLTCSTASGAPGGTAGTTGPGTAGGTGTGMTGVISSQGLANCTTVASIMPETGSSARGR